MQKVRGNMNFNQLQIEGSGLPITRALQPIRTLQLALPSKTRTAAVMFSSQAKKSIATERKTGGLEQKPSQVMAHV